MDFGSIPFSGCLPSRNRGFLWLHVCVYPQLCPNLCDPVDCSCQAPLSVLEWVDVCTPGELHNPCIKAASLVSPALSSGFSTTMPPGNPFLQLPLLLKCVCVDHE